MTLLFIVGSKSHDLAAILENLVLREYTTSLNLCVSVDMYSN